MRYCEADIKELLDNECEEIEVNSKVSKDVGPMMHVVEVLENDLVCNKVESSELVAPNFKKHSMHSKKSIHISVRINGITSHALIDCGATDNFTNLAFMRKKKLQPVLLNQARIYRIERGNHGGHSRILAAD